MTIWQIITILKFEVAKEIELTTDEFIILNYKYLGRNKI